MNLKIGVFAMAAGLVGASAFLQSQRPSSMPDLGGAIGWLNSSPLNAKALRGKVVLVNFWTYTCINSLRPMPYLKSWAAKYKDAGLVVIGVHTPEFSFEHERPNVEWATRTFNISFPVAIDSDYNIWQAFHNEAWPAPETYIGYRQTKNFSSPEKLARDSRATYTAPVSLSLNQWGLIGSWNVGPEAAALQATPGKVMFRFHSRDLHLILAPAKDGKPVRFKVTLDGTALGENHGSDSAADGTGEVREPRLYQLIRQKGAIIDRTFEIEFIDSGVQVLDFTFG